MTVQTEEIKHRRGERINLFFRTYGAKDTWWMVWSWILWW